MIPAHPEAIERAADVRVALRLGDDPVPDIITVLEQRGLAVFVEPDPRAAEGAYFPGERIQAVFLNGTLPLPRLRSVAAHELGHHEFGDAPVLDQAISNQSEASKGDADLKERRADAFAMNFLMPESGIAARLGLNAAIDTGAVLRLATQFGVTYAGMVERLEELGVLAPRDQRRLLANHAAALSSDYRHVDVRQLRLPADYVRRAFDAYGSAKISFGRLFELLHLPPGAEQERALLDQLRQNDLLQPEDSNRFPRRRRSPSKPVRSRAEI